MQEQLKDYYKEIEVLLKEVDNLSLKMDASYAMSAMAIRLIVRADKKFNGLSNLGELKLNSEMSVKVLAIKVSKDNIIVDIRTPYFRADVYLSTLTNELLQQLAHLVADKCKIMAFGPTITNIILDKKNIPIRLVDVGNLVNCKVCADLTAPSMDFYVPHDVFYEYNDEELKKYCEEQKEKDGKI